MTQTSRQTGSDMTEAEQQYPLAPSLLDAQTYRDPVRYQREVEDVLLQSWFPVFPSADVPAARLRGVGATGSVGRGHQARRRIGRGVHNVCQHLFDTDVLVEVWWALEYATIRASRSSSLTAPSA